MGKFDRLLMQILSGSSDASIRFSDLCQLLLKLGFDERIRSSHHLFRKSGLEEKINIQKDDDKAKPYQVCQVWNVIVKYHLGGDR
jgi:predicted RNA binding protein YcfA (HicA-like mRNA interferase family)